MSANSAAPFPTWTDQHHSPHCSRRHYPVMFFNSHKELFFSYSTTKTRAVFNPVPESFLKYKYALIPQKRSRSSEDSSTFYVNKLRLMSN